MNIHDLRLGCALAAMLLPAVCLVRACALDAAGTLPPWGMPAVLAYLALALCLGLASLRPRPGLTAGNLGSAAAGFAIGAAVGDPLLAAVPLAALALVLAMPALTRGAPEA